jgi:hypothetical protein
MKHILFFSLFVLLFSCEKNTDADNGCTPEHFLYNGFNNKQINIVQAAASYQIVTGSNLVFEYSKVFRDCPDVSDLGGSDNLVFEVPVNSNNFTYTDAGLSNLNCYSKLTCYCLGTNAIPVTQGTISGTKTGANNWDINVTVSINSGGVSRSYNFRKSFLVQ